RRPADVDLAHHLGTTSLHHLDRAATVERAQLEVLARPMLHDGVGGRDAQSVPTLLRLRAVGVEDSTRHRPRVKRRQAIGAESAEPVAYHRKEGDDLVQRPGHVEQQVVVAERLVLDQVYLRHRRKFSGILRPLCWFSTIESLMRDVICPAQRLTHIPACYCSYPGRLLPPLRRAHPTLACHPLP